MRIAVLSDYWNFQLTLNEKVAKKQGVADARVKIAWSVVGQELVNRACAVLACDPAAATYEGTYIYTSFNPTTPEGRKFRNWATTWLDRQPGINVKIRERKPKALPRCPICHREITHCPHTACGQPIVATVEKGIDTLLVTDLIRLAYSNTYDVAVLATSDADMVPAVEFIQQAAGKKVIQAGFPPKGVDLATECWGSFNVMDIADKIQRS
jgi:NYN domain